MKATTTFWMTVLATMAAFSLNTADAEQWRGFVQLETAQQFESPGIHTTMTGFGGGQVGRFIGIGFHNVGPKLSLEGQTFWSDDNGDLLMLSYSGQIEATLTGPYAFNGIMTVVGGTGRFEHSRGSAVMTGTMDTKSQDIQFDFEGELHVPGNFEMSGAVAFGGMHSGQGQLVQYSMYGETSVLDVLSQTGSLQPTSVPEIDDSNPEVTVISFEAEQGYNEELGRRLHVIRCENGDIYASFQAFVQIEIENELGRATKTVDARYTIQGGTNIFENASGGWQATMTTKTSYGDGPVFGYFQFDGDLQLDMITDSGIDTRPSQVDAPSVVRDTADAPKIEFQALLRRELTVNESLKALGETSSHVAPRLKLQAPTKRLSK